MVLAREERVLKLIGSPSTQEQQGLDIDSAILDGDKIVIEYTKQADWDPVDTYGYTWAQEAAEKWAASRLCDEWQNMNQKSERYKKEAMEALQTLRQIGYGTMHGDNPTFYSTVTSYKTVASSTVQPLRYRSSNAFGGTYD